MRIRRRDAGSDVLVDDPDDDGWDDDEDDPAAEPAGRRRPPRWWRVLRTLLWWVVAAVLAVVLVIGAALWVLNRGGSGTPPVAARTSGHDAVWLGHSWVDGRSTQADVDALARQLAGGGVSDLYVHAGPYEDDGTLDASLRPRAKWLIGALHTALPGVRVQAWLGDVVGDGRMDLSSETTQQRVLAGATAVLDDGFDGVHYDFEPVASGNEDLLTVLTATHTLTKTRGKVLSVSAAHLEPFNGIADVVAIAPGDYGLWSPNYLGRVAKLVDQVAVMSYDTGLRPEGAYVGYVRRTTERALEEVPQDVTLVIGLPAYHDDTVLHPDSENVAAAARGVRLALDDPPSKRPFGVALYVDFAATPADWTAYFTAWVR